MNTSAIATFCEDLRKAREFQRVSLEDIAKSTRLSVEFLSAVESGQWDEIPAAYLQGYVGMYAQAVGMNREKVLQYYRQLVEPEAVISGAILNTAPPLVDTDDEVGLTRAKIAAPFFTRLATKRKLLFVLVASFAILFLAFAVWIESTVTVVKTPTVPFEVSLADYETKLHSSYKRIPLDSMFFSQSEMAKKNNWAQILCSESGGIAIELSGAPTQIFSYTPFDTLEIEYINSVTLRIFPARNAMVIDHEQMLLPPDPSRTDTAIYIIDTKNIEKQ